MPAKNGHDLVTQLAAVEADAEARRKRVTDAKAAHAEAEDAAEVAEAEARSAQLQFERAPSRGLVHIMREIGSAIDAAKEAAVDAVLAGTDPARVWIDYRLEAARQLGRWQAVSNEYQTIIAPGGRVPPGPGHRVTPLPRYNANGSMVLDGPSETFDHFMTEILRAAEVEVHEQSRNDTTDSLRDQRK